MKPAICPNCGANITVDERKDAGICEFCNTAFVTEKAISQINHTSNNAQTIINNYYNTQAPTQTQKEVEPPEPSPTINVGLAVFCACFIYSQALYT